MKKLAVCVQKMTENIMQSLEAKGLINRLLPSKPSHRLSVNKGEGKGGYIYKSDAKYGAHSLVNVAIDNTVFSSFATHPDNEEIFLLGGRNEKKLLLLICYLSRMELQKKIDSGKAEAQDFICLECVFCDPYLSFFVMNKNVLHGECIVGDGNPATFYCTESDGLPLEKFDLYSDLEIKLAFNS